MKITDLKKLKMPDKPGVYFFLGAPKLGEGGRKGKTILYVGKATSLRDRVKSYFGKDLIATRGLHLLDMVTVAEDIKWQETDSVLEALILESNLIKKHLPKYNTKEKDNKSYNYVCITKDEIPKVLIIRGRVLNKTEYKYIYGPFPNGNQLKEAMRIIRRIFPYIDKQSSVKNNIVFYGQLELTPKSILEYKNNIKNLNLFFQGKKKSILINLKRQMAAFSKFKDFENAAKVRDQIFALNHINDVALIKEETLFTSRDYSNFSRFTPEGPYTSKNLNNLASFRIEAYDIAHMGGKNMVGVMTVVENNEPDKKEYRKFIIRTQEGSNDTGALEEVLSRRLRHLEWGLPNLIVVDGNIAQINVANRVLDKYQFHIPIVSVVKDDKHKARAIMGDENLINEHKKAILLANNESHRFAITFHKLKRDKNFLKSL